MSRSPQSSQNGRLRIVAAIPSSDAEPFIADLVTKAKKYVDRVIVVDDGSCDNTAEVASISGATVISHGKNLGKGAALRTAVENADADIVVFLDGDGQHNPEDIPELLAPIIRGEAQLVIGSRHLNGSEISHAPPVRIFSNRLASLVISLTISVLLPIATLLNRLVRPKKSQRRSTRSSASSLNGKLKWITDCTSGFRAITKEGWQRLAPVSQGFQIETEMIYEAARNGLAIVEVPIRCTWGVGHSRLHIFRDGIKTLVMLTRKLTSEVVRR